MRGVWFIDLAVGRFGGRVRGRAAGSDGGRYGGRHHTGPPDTFVADWDAVGTQAFTAAALSPAEGHTIFAYVAIAVYDSVMAVKGGYEPFAVDVDAPGGASAEAAVAAAAHRILVHYLPAQAARSSIRPTRRRWPPSPTAKPRRTGSPPARRSPPV